MAVRTPRRTFATPFVVTLATVPACFVSSSTPPSQPISQPAPGQPEQTDPNPRPPPPQEQSPVIVANPPRPTQPPPSPPVNPPPPDTTPATSKPPADGKWTVFKSSTGCTVADAHASSACPKGAMCNPPPPQPYACPANVTKFPATIVVFGTSCMVEREPQKCPPRVMCNPPPPQIVPCP